MIENVELRPMTADDYDEVHALWMTIKGFGIRSIDDERDDVEKFIKRNPRTSVVAVLDGKIIGSILCGNDGRQGSLYHVCVAEGLRRNGVGSMMVNYCMDLLKHFGINKVSLVAYTRNDVGNAFWNGIGWTKREDYYYYDFVLNEENKTNFIGD